jgi:hypothetical protein
MRHARGYYNLARWKARGKRFTIYLMNRPGVLKFTEDLKSALYGLSEEQLLGGKAKELIVEHCLKMRRRS